MELSIRTVYYRKQHITHPFFKSSAKVLAIYNLNKEIVYISDSGAELMDLIGESFLNRYENKIDKERFVFCVEPNHRYLSTLQSIRNGYFLSMENIDGLFQLRNELKEKNISLKNKREYLDKEKNILEELRRLEIGQDILGRMEEEASNSLERLKRYIGELYKGEDIKKNADYIYLVCKYIKQKTQMTVLSMNKEVLSKDYANDMIDDLISSIKNKDIDIYIVVAGEENIPVKSLIVLNELVVALLLAVIEYENPSIYGRVVNYTEYMDFSANLSLKSKDMINLLDEIDGKKNGRKMVKDFLVTIEEDNINFTGKIIKGGWK